MDIFDEPVGLLTHPIQGAGKPEFNCHCLGLVKHHLNKGMYSLSESRCQMAIFPSLVAASLGHHENPYVH